MLVAQYVETIACLARRRVLDASLLVDAVGFMLRSRWNTILPFVERLRRVRDNEYLFENFEWLATYSTWWKDTPSPPRDSNYDPQQFGDIAVQGVTRTLQNENLHEKLLARDRAGGGGPDGARACGA